MRWRDFIFLVAGATAAWPLPAPAQQSGKVYRVGVLNAGTAGATTPELAAVSRDAFQKLGWIEGENITFERRYAENHPDRLPELAAEFGEIPAGDFAGIRAERAFFLIKSDRGIP